MIINKYNPRKISDKQMNDLKKSLNKYGVVDPIIINKSPERLNIVIGGHQRLRACKELGIKEIDCVELNLSLEKEKELNIRLNKINGNKGLKGVQVAWNKGIKSNKSNKNV